MTCWKQEGTSVCKWFVEQGLEEILRADRAKVVESHDYWRPEGTPYTEVEEENILKTVRKFTTGNHWVKTDLVICWQNGRLTYKQSNF